LGGSPRITQPPIGQIWGGLKEAILVTKHQKGEGERERGGESVKTKRKSVFWTGKVGKGKVNLRRTQRKSGGNARTLQRGWWSPKKPSLTEKKITGQNWYQAHLPIGQVNKRPFAGGQNTREKVGRESSVRVLPPETPQNGAKI